MTEEKIRVDAKLDSEKWQEIKDYIDNRKETRKHSKQFYLERILEMGLTLKRHRESQEEKHTERYKEIQKKSKHDMGIGQEDSEDRDKVM